MKKRIFAIVLILALVAACLCGCGNSGSSAPETQNTTATDAEATAKTINLKFGHAASESHFLHVGATVFKEKLEELSNGTMTVDIYPNGTLGTLREMVEGVQNGDIDMCVAISTVVESFCPEVAGFDLPFLVDDLDHADRIMNSELTEYLDEKLEENGLINLGWWEVGFRSMIFKQEASSIDDLAGLQIRIMSSETFEKMMKALGLNPVVIDNSELYTALQQGAVDGAENGYSEFVDYSMYEVTNYLYQTRHVYSPMCCMISPAVWESLTEEQQAWVQQAADAATAAAVADSRAKVDVCIETLIEKGMTVVEFDREDLKNRCASVYAEYPQFDEMVEIINSYR